MFQSVRPNSQLYILHKGDKLALDVGYVTNQPIAKPKYQIPQAFGQTQETVVDIIVKVGDTTINLNSIPANLDIADSYSNGESIVVSTSREAMNAEILSIKQKSIDTLNSREFHNNRINECDTILGILNPEYAEKQTQKEEMNELKNQVSTLSAQVNRLVEALLKQNNNEQSLGNKRTPQG